MQPHFGNPVVRAGVPVASAAGAMVLMHGRSAAPANILDLFKRLERPQLAAIAPAATGGTWYPQSFLAPREHNEPGITSGLFVIETLVSELIAGGMKSEKIILLGFSQGACLTAEFALRHPRHYGGVMVLSGGLIGPPGTRWDNISADYEGTPVFFGCSDVDAHIPKERVLESEAVFARHGASVTRRLYPNMGHLVNEDEIAFVQHVIDAAIA